MQPPVTYWEVVATVMPVIALALTVEARTIGASWDIDLPRRLRILQAGVFGIPLICLTVGEVQALAVLRNDQIFGPWADICYFTIQVSLAVLVQGPGKVM